MGQAMALATAPHLMEEPSVAARAVGGMAALMVTEAAAAAGEVGVMAGISRNSTHLPARPGAAGAAPEARHPANDLRALPSERQIGAGLGLG